MRRWSWSPRAAILSLVAACFVFLWPGVWPGIGPGIWPAPERALARLTRAAGPILFTTGSPEAHDGRLWQHVSANDPALGPIGFMISRPDPAPDHPIPVTLVLGGLGPGSASLKLVGGFGANALVGYDWQIPADYPKGTGIADVPATCARALAMPAQAVAILAWLRTQPWVDPARISLVGFSLGAIAAPAVADLARIEGLPINWTVFAYGGAPISGLFAGDQRIRPRWLRAALGLAAERLLWPLDPTEHLPSLTGRSLILGSPDDRTICRACAFRFVDLTPPPFTFRELPGGHVSADPEQHQILTRALSMTIRWLAETGAIDPVPAVSGESD